MPGASAAGAQNRSVSFVTAPIDASSPLSSSKVYRTLSAHADDVALVFTSWAKREHFTLAGTQDE